MAMHPRCRGFNSTGTRSHQSRALQRFGMDYANARDLQHSTMVGLLEGQSPA
jgi:hypothetical protein